MSRQRPCPARSGSSGTSAIALKASLTLAELGSLLEISGLASQAIHNPSLLGRQNTSHSKSLEYVKDLLNCIYLETPEADLPQAAKVVVAIDVPGM